MLVLSLSRAVHAHWWEGSWRLLGYCHDDNNGDAVALDGEGFGVTPAVMSTGGVINVLARLKQVFRKEEEETGISFVTAWLEMWGPSCW